MRRDVAVTGAILLLLGFGVFAWKVFLLDLPVVPSDDQGLWSVELAVDVRGSGRRGSVSAALPTSGDGQLVSDESVVSDRLVFTIRSQNGERVGVWKGAIDGVHNLTHRFRVQLAPVRPALPEGRAKPPPESVEEEYGRPTATLPADALVMHDLIESLNLPDYDDAAGRVRTLFAFVADEISLIPEESEDPVLALEGREANEEGQARLLATLLRADGWPSRLVRGLELHEVRSPRETVWVECWLGGRWIPMSPSLGFFAQRPADLLKLRIGSGELVRSTRITALSSRYRSLRERLSATELASLMEPPNPVLAELSLYRLPVASQKPLSLLLLIPLGALAMALMRNVIGVTTFGTFLPVLVALALRETDLRIGLLMLASVILVGAASRMLLDRLHLLLVPRLCIILSVVVLIVIGLAVAGRRSETQDLFSGVLLPIVILSMLIERFAITASEEGLLQAMIRLAWTGVVAIAIYPIFRSEFAGSLFFGFPELVICVMGVLVWIGGYTGYRLFELFRFRSFATAEPDGGP